MPGSATSARSACQPSALCSPVTGAPASLPRPAGRWPSRRPQSAACLDRSGCSGHRARPSGGCARAVQRRAGCPISLLTLLGQPAHERACRPEIKFALPQPLRLKLDQHHADLAVQKSGPVDEPKAHQCCRHQHRRVAARSHQGNGHAAAVLCFVRPKRTGADERHDGAGRAVLASSC